MGDVIVMRTNMTSLNGIDIGNHDLYAIGNQQLQTLDGLSSHTEIGNFFIADNPLLSSLGTQIFFGGPANSDCYQRYAAKSKWP